MRTLKNTQLKKYGLFFYDVKNDFQSYLHLQVCVRALTRGGAIGNFPEEEGPATHDNKISSHNHDNHNNVTKVQSADLMENEVKEMSSPFSTSEITTEKILDVVFYYQEFISEWVKRVSPRPSPFTLACGATLYLLALCTAIQRQEGDRWFSVFIDSKVPGLSEPSQKSMWDSFENVTSQYVTLNQKAKTLDSHSIDPSPKMIGQQPASTSISISKGVRQVDPAGDNSETQSLCDSSVISRVDLYKKRVLIRLKSPWDKQSQQQYAGLFYDQNKLKGFAKMNRGNDILSMPSQLHSEAVISCEGDRKVLPDTFSELPGTDKTFLQKPSRGIQSWYKIEARNDENPILLSEGVSTKKEKSFYDNKIKNPSADVLDFAATNQSTGVGYFSNPLEKTKNWFFITHNISLWDYFPLQRSQEQVYFGGDNVPSKLDSALFSSSFQCSSAKQPEPCFGSSLETGQKAEGYTFSKAKIDENLFLEQKAEDNNKNQSRAEIIEHLYINKPKFSLSNLGLSAKREALVEEKVKAFSEKSTRNASQFLSTDVDKIGFPSSSSQHFVQSTGVSSKQSLQTLQSKGDFSNPSSSSQHFVQSTSQLRCDGVDKMSFQKLPLNQDNTFGFTCCDFGEFNFSPSVLRPAPSVSSSTHTHTHTHKRVRENDLVGVSYFSNHSYKTSLNGRSLPLANISDKLSLSRQILDPQKLKVWFETNKDLANGDEVYGFENKLKSLFYSQGILPFPEFDDLDDKLFKLDRLNDELFEESEEKQEKSWSDFTKKGQESFDSELLPFSEQKDEAGFSEYSNSEEESALGEEAINFLPVSKQNLFSQDFNDSIADVPSPFHSEAVMTDVSRSASSFAATNPEGSDDASQDFLPSHFYKNTWISPRFMSGYQFPELTKRDIFRLQKRFLIHHFLPSLPKACIGLEKDSFFTVFNTQKLASKISLLPLEIHLPPVLPASLFRDMFSPSFFNSFRDQQGALCAAFTDPADRNTSKNEDEEQRLLMLANPSQNKTKGGVSSELDKSAPYLKNIRNELKIIRPESNDSPETISQERVKIPELKLAYCVIELEEKKEVEKAFTKFGRDYNEYLTYPKEGWRALKVSPSLEDDEKDEESLEKARKEDSKEELGKIIKKFAYRRGYAVKKEKETCDLPDINNSDLNPWFFSLLGPENMLSDRKTSFLGIKNVLRKRVNSRERKDIAAEISNVKNLAFKRLKTRAFRNDILLIAPPKLEMKNDFASQHHVVEVNSLLRKKPVVATNIVTPFEGHLIMPEISKNQWRKIIEYQIRSYLFEEDNRLEPLVKKNPHHHFKIQRVNTFLPWFMIRTPKDKAVEWPITRLDYEKIDGTTQDFLLPKYSTINTNSYVKTDKFQAPPDNLAQNILSKQKGTLSFRKREGNAHSFFSFPSSSSQHFVPSTSVSRYASDSSALRADDNSGVSSSATPNQHTTRGQYRWVPSKLREWTNYVLEEIKKFKLASSRSKKVLRQQLNFEPFTKHSWLLIYRFFLVFAFRDVGKYLYRIMLKDFVIRMADTYLGRAVTSEKFRKNLQHVPLKLFYKPHKRLQDVVGLQHLIPALDDIIWFLRNSGRGRGVPRGVILVGPPGTGKTVLVQAIAGEAQVPVVVESMSSLSIPDPEKRPHERLQKMFQIARQQAPCILFLDEIDRIAESRGSVVTNDIGPPDSLISLEADIGAEPSYALQTELLPKGDTSLTTKELKDVSLHQEKKEREARRVNILLRLLTQIDGLRSLNGVLLIATTNRPAVLDPALLRPGRFSKMIYLQLPSHKKRIDLFKLNTKKIGSQERMPWDYLASRTADMSGTDIAAAINHSAIRAILANTVHTLETLEQGLNYVTGAPVSFASLPDVSQHQEIKNRIRAGLRGRETNSKAAFTETTKGGPEFRSAYGKTKMSKILHARVSEKLADTVYAVYGVFNQKVYTPKVYSQKLAFQPTDVDQLSLPVNKHFSERIKEACNTSRIAYYQAGKGVVQSVLPTHPNVGFLALSPDTNNESPFTTTSWDKITSSQLNHRKVDLETKIIGLYAGKAGEMLHLNVNSFKNYSSPQLADHNQRWLYKAKSARPVSTNGGPWLSQSNLGFSELLFASSLAHVMIDRWYLYSKRMFSLKTNRLTMALNEEQIFNDDLFPMFAKLCDELDRDRPKESTSSSSKELFGESEEMHVSRAEKEGGVYALMEGIDQQNIILAWWQDQMYKRIEMADKPYSQWYRIYLPKPEEKERNEEWVAPDFYYHQDLDLASITQDQSNAIDAIKLRSKTLHKVLTQNSTHLSPPTTKHFKKWTGVRVRPPSTLKSGLLSQLHSEAVISCDGQRWCDLVVAQNNQKSGDERKKFVFLPKTNKIKITKPGNPHHQALQKVDSWRGTPEVVTLYGRPISLSVKAAKTWNDMYWLERDYSYHQLVTTCFYTSFLHLDENRELLDFLADHLIRFQKLRKHEILRICSLFQVKTCSEQYLTLGSKADKQTRQDQINTDQKDVILSENSAPFIPSWWEQKTAKQALLSSFTGSPPPSTSKSGNEVTMKSNSEPPDFEEGVKREDKAQNAGWKRDFLPATLRRKAQSADTPSKVVKNEVPAAALPTTKHFKKWTGGPKVDEKAQTVTPQSSESKDYSKLLPMTQEAEENFEPKLQENQEEQFKETIGLEGKESDKPQNEFTSLMRISSTSSTSTDTSDADKKEHNVEVEADNDRFAILEEGWGRFSKYNRKKYNVENDRFWILEEGWGRYSKYKKPNFIRFDFIKVR